ncbi:type II toxin-antitoxin system VapC family toxin [Bosea sp. RCC_152_1]|uniref:type II toxin-antitoxin system VapC family toxin n=1 Tax=Bosea sp. RCC_152_1 TaxID=3239228 RepID=UPI003524CDEC
MERVVVDASVAIKWVVAEEGSQVAVDLRSQFRFASPELLIPECANILWKKTQRGELTREEAILAARLLERSGVAFLSMAGLLERSTSLAIELSHPAYDCTYLAAAVETEARFVTADTRLLRIIAQRGSSELASSCLSLADISNGRH